MDSFGLPGREIFSTFRDRGVQIAEHVGVYGIRGFFRSVFGGNEMHAAESFELAWQIRVNFHAMKLDNVQYRHPDIR
jgi:hypothetical protein